MKTRIRIHCLAAASLPGLYIIMHGLLRETNFGLVMMSMTVSTILSAVSSSHTSMRPSSEFSTNMAFLGWSAKIGRMRRGVA